MAWYMMIVFPGSLAEFPKLKRLHLHKLSELYGIVSRKVPRVITRIYAPNLESVKISGYWSLRKLPTVGDDKVVRCDCEKEWWDELLWDESRVQPRNYKPDPLVALQEDHDQGSPLRCVRCHHPSPAYDQCTQAF